MLLARAETTIEAPIDRVYRFLVDLDKLPLYDARVASARLVDRDLRRVALEGYFRSIPYQASFEFSCWPNKGYQLALVQGPARHALGRYLLRPLGLYTRLVYSEELALAGPWRWPLEAWARRQFQQEAEAAVASIKSLVERAGAWNGWQMPEPAYLAEGVGFDFRNRRHMPRLAW